MKPNWFVALPVPSGDWSVKVTQNTPAGFRVFHPADLHITVAFLGPCTPKAAHAGWNTLTGKEHPPIQVQLESLCGMGNPRRPSAYALTLSKGGEETAQLMAHWRPPIYEAAGARADERPPLPHITVARPPRKAKAEMRHLGRDWVKTQSVPAAEFLLERIALYTWSVDRQTQLFQIVEERSLNGN